MKIQLSVGGRKYSGWEKISITKSMTSLTDSFNMQIFKGDEVQILEDDVIQILVDDKVFFTGYLDDINIGLSDIKKPLSLNGRSRPLDLIDCNISEIKQYNKQNIKQIMNDLTSNFQITTTSNVKLEPLEVFDTRVGETYFNAINRLCKQTNTLPISDKLGNIKIVKNIKKEHPIILKDKDFKSIDYPRNLSKRFNVYFYKSESILSDVTDGVIVDESVKRYRPFVDVNNEDKAKQELAEWKLNHNKAQSINITAVVNNWDLEINTILKIETSLVNGSFLIKDINYTKDNSGTVSKVILVSKDLYV